MNENELVALEYLKKKYPNDNIEKIQNPDFKVGNEYFEVKVVGNNENNNINITDKQIETFDFLNPSLILIKESKILKIEKWDKIKNTLNLIGVKKRKITEFNEAIDYAKIKNLSGSLYFTISDNICDMLGLNKDDFLKIKIEVVRRAIDNSHFNEKGEIIND